jgi:hypothetical protein
LIATIHHHHQLSATLTNQPNSSTSNQSISHNNNASTMNETDLHYPPDTCPFCTIASAYPFPANPLWETSNDAAHLEKCVPAENEVDVDKTAPSSFVVLRSRDVVAFLDILPMVGGEFLRCG